MGERRASRSGALRGVRVLIVEDEFIVSLTLKVQLEAMGCRVLATVRDAASAIQQARALRPDVVLMDIGLSGSDGLEATQVIAAQVPTRVIVVTAYGDDRAQQLMQVGACSALTKPIIEEQLAEAIANAMAERQGDSRPGSEDSIGEVIP